MEGQIDEARDVIHKLVPVGAQAPIAESTGMGCCIMLHWAVMLKRKAGCYPCINVRESCFQS